MTRFSETFHLNLNDISNIKILSKLFHWHVIKDYTRDSNIQTAVDAIFLIVLDKCLYNSTYHKLVNKVNMAIYEGILGTVICIPHNFIENGQILIVLLPMLIELMDHLESTILFLHFLINHGKIEYILSRIVYHILSKWSSFPKFIIITHFLRNLMLLCMSYIYIVLQEISKRYVIVLEILEFLGLIESLLNHSMSYLSIKYEITDHVILIDESWLIFAEIMENLHNAFGYHNIF